jgi:hypothetical protein
VKKVRLQFEVLWYFFYKESHYGEHVREFLFLLYSIYEAAAINEC